MWQDGTSSLTVDFTVRARVSNSQADKQIEGLPTHLIGWKKHIWEEQNRKKKEALSRKKHLDNVEGTRTLSEEEMTGWQARREIINEDDRKLEMDWRQLWCKRVMLI